MTAIELEVLNKSFVDKCEKAFLMIGFNDWVHSINYSEPSKLGYIVFC